MSRSQLKQDLHVLEFYNQQKNQARDNHAVFSQSGLTLKFSSSGLLSGITEYIDRHAQAKQATQIEVKTITLQELLDKYNAPRVIHYFSLDTEGSELEILKSVDFSKYIFLYINLEHNYIEPRRTEIRNLLLQNGYLYKGPNDFDDDYIHESIITGIYYFAKNYAKPILVERLEGNTFKVSSPYWEDDYGEYENGVLKWKRLGTGKVTFSNIECSVGNVWHR